MNNDHAKIVLGVYRLDGRDADDPFFREALAQAKRDPSLASWLEAEQRQDAAIVGRLRAARVPADYKMMTVAAMGVSAGRARHRWPLLLAGGLALPLVVGLVLGFKSTSMPFREDATLAQIATNLAEHHASIGLMSGDLVRVRKWISDNGGIVPKDLPPGLAKLMVLGCETWNTTRGRVSLVCYVGENKQIVQLYVFEVPVDRPGFAASTEPQFTREGNWALALWRTKDRAYVLGAPADSDLLISSLFRS